MTDDAFARDLAVLDRELEDRETAQRLVVLAQDLTGRGAEACAGVQALLREVHGRDPGELAATLARIRMARLRLMDGRTCH